MTGFLSSVMVVFVVKTFNADRGLFAFMPTRSNDHVGIAAQSKDCVSAALPRWTHFDAMYLGVIVEPDM